MIMFSTWNRSLKRWNFMKRITVVHFISYTYKLTKSLFMCLFVCFSLPLSGPRPPTGASGHHTGRHFAGRRPSRIEYCILEGQVLEKSTTFIDIFHPYSWNYISICHVCFFKSWGCWMWEIILKIEWSGGGESNILNKATCF